MAEHPLPEKEPRAERIRALGLSCGFDAVGFARVEPVDKETQQLLRDWLSKGYQAGMSYLEDHIEERLDPSRILPSAKTVVVVLANYYREQPDHEIRQGKIARYAGGRDYHKVLRGDLNRFRKSIEESFAGVEVWCEVDTGPVLERYWAEKAGVGWIGKNTLLINKGYGSWCFIGILLVSLEIVPDMPHPFHCGTCTRCLEACPTRAILEPGVLDSNRCISYWTIEHRGDLPQEADLHGWIFGCDDCQTVCPWNRRATPASREAFHLKEDLQTPDLVRWASLCREEWDTLTQGTALRRAGYEGWIRNCRTQSHRRVE
jgi:epoxyqueuosine reductase